MEGEDEPYAIQGKLYIIFGLCFIDRFSSCGTNFFKVGSIEACFFFKLTG